MRVSDLLEMESLPGLRILAGMDGVNRKVSTVSVMDAPDICDWMQGGEFLITSGYTIMAHPVALGELVCNLNKVRVAALGIKADRFIGKIDPQVLETADGIGFPIIYIPVDYSFAEIINPVLTALVNKQAQDLLYSEKIHKAFLELALEERAIQDVIDTLAEILHKDVAFKDYVFHQTFFSPQADAHKLAHETTVKHQVTMGGQRYGCLFILDYPDQIVGKYEKIAIEHASTILVLLIQKKVSNREIEYRYRSELIHDILTDNYIVLQEVQSRAALYHWTFKHGMRVLVYDIDHYKKGYLEAEGEAKRLEWVHKPMIRIIKTHLSPSFTCYYISYSDTIVFLVEYVPDDERDTKAHLSQINQEINAAIEAETGYTTTIGVGDYKSSVAEASQSYAEAKLAVQVAHMRNERNCTIFHSDLGIFKFLYDIHESVDGRDFVDETLMPLINYDQEHHTEFYPTLAKIVELDWNLHQASERLHIHYNTAKYRFKRAEEILGLDCSAYQNKLKIELAICWKQIVNS